MKEEVEKARAKKRARERDERQQKNGGRVPKSADGQSALPSPKKSYVITGAAENYSRKKNTFFGNHEKYQCFSFFFLFITSFRFPI